MMLQRDGLQELQVRNARSKRSPSFASRSMLGVRMLGLPYTPTSSRPRSSAMISTMFGRPAAASAAPGESARPSVSAQPGAERLLTMKLSRRRPIDKEGQRATLRPDRLRRQKIDPFRAFQHRGERLRLLRAADQEEDLGGGVDRLGGQGDPMGAELLDPGGADQAPALVQGGAARGKRRRMAVGAQTQKDEIERRSLSGRRREPGPQHGFVLARGILRARRLAANPMDVRL